MLSKKFCLIVGMITTCSFSILLQASDVNREKISNFSRVATLITFLTPAPLALGYSISKLQQARQFEKLIETPYEANEILSRQARHLRKRGCIGLVIGTMLTAPHVMSMKIAHDVDKQRDTILSSANVVVDVPAEPAN